LDATRAARPLRPISQWADDSPVVVTESTGPVTVSTVHTSDFLAPDELDPYIQLVSARDGADYAEITTCFHLVCVEDAERSDG
jgi:hypothetical protein